MSAPAAWSRRDQVARIAVSIALGCILVFPVLQTVVRQVAPPLAIVAALALVLGHLFSRPAGPPLAALRDTLGFEARWPDVTLLAAIAALLTASIGWAPNPAHSAEVVAQILSAVALCFALARMRGLLPLAELEKVVPLAVLSGSAMLLVMLDHGTVIRDLLGQRQYATDSNRGAVLLALMLPLAVWYAHRRHGWPWAMLILSVAVFAIFRSHSESSKLAVLAAGVTALLCHVAPRAVSAATLLLMVALTLLTPLLAQHIMHIVPDWVFANTDNLTFRVRAQLWETYAGLIEARPFLGWGVDASRGAIRMEVAGNLGPEQQWLLVFNHSHNAILQIWVDLGIVGVGLLVLAMIRLWRRFAAMPVRFQPLAHATAMAGLSVSAVSHGAWQSWWFCLVGMVICAFPATSDEARRS